MQSSSDGFVFEQLDSDGVVSAQVTGPADVAAELADVREMARAEGFEEGRAAGLVAARAELQTAAAAFAEALDQSARRVQADAELLEWQAVELALQLGEKVLSGALEVQPERVLDVIRGALRRLVERESVTVLVNPDDLELVSDALASVAGSLGGIERLEAQGERRVGRGGAVLRTPVGEIDAGVETQLRRAREIVMRELAAPELDLGSLDASELDGPVVDGEPAAAS